MNYVGRFVVPTEVGTGTPLGIPISGVIERDHGGTGTVYQILSIFALPLTFLCHYTHLPSSLEPTVLIRLRFIALRTDTARTSHNQKVGNDD